MTRQPVNFAKGMPTKQSSWYTPKSLALEAHAVDGNTDGNYAHGSSSQTQWFDKDPWWIVHLSKTIVVIGVIIYNRVDCCGMYGSFRKTTPMTCNLVVFLFFLNPKLLLCYSVY